MDLQLREVNNLKELRKFILFPFQLYQGNPQWVPPLIFDEFNTLRRDKNPAFEHCQARYWLAYSRGKVVGRIAGILNQHHIEKWQQKYVRFGWFDFIDEPEVSKTLLSAVEEWARDKGMTAVHGPLGFTDMDREGMLVEGFDEPGTMITLYNFPYYLSHMEGLGYTKDTDWVEYEINVPSRPDEKIQKLSEIVLKRNQLRMLQVKKKNELLPYANDLFQLLNDEYAHLYGMVPLTAKQVESYTKQYFGFIHPDFAPIILDGNNHMVAFGISMPSLTTALQKARGRLFPLGLFHLLRAFKRNVRADLYLVAVKSEFQGMGLNAVLINWMNQVFNQRGITKIESNPELETNLPVQAQWRHFEKRQHKRRRCFIKDLC